MRKFLVVVDDTPECGNAIRFAARRAQHTGGGVVLLYVTPRDGFEHWMGVAEVMREEAREKAEDRLAEVAREVRELSGVIPEFVIREDGRGDPVADRRGRADRRSGAGRRRARARGRS